MASKRTTLSEISQFCDVAQNQFGLYLESGRGEQNPLYLDVLTRLSEGRLFVKKKRGRSPYEFTHPLIFLTGIQNKSTDPSVEQKTAGLPSVSFVVGQYGLGKTELMFQVCHHVLSNNHGNTLIDPLPINLGTRRDWMKNLTDNTPAEVFSELIFGHLLNYLGLGYDFIKNELLPDINRGRVLLILDGLDELISTQTQHNQFFKGLIGLLTSGSKNEDMTVRFHVIITMRLEYLSGMAKNDASDLVKMLQSRKFKRKSIPVYFLEMDYLNDSMIESYLHYRIKNRSDVYAMVSRNSRLLDLLRRPLLLRMFCDFANFEGPSLDKLMESLQENEHPGRLIESFIDAASIDKHLTDEQARLQTVVTWDNDLIADKSLDLYRNAKSEMDIRDIKSFLKPYQDQIAPNAIKALPPEEALKGIHKCPFLRQEQGPIKSETEPVVRFAHRIFFEYFTAKGMANELNKGDGNFIGFDDLVLNVDMRKFLKELVPDWYARTQKSYALDEEGRKTWKIPDTLSLEEREAYFAELNKKRIILLDSMTEPTRPNAGFQHDVRNAIEWFLNVQNQWLHPRYLIYNYEAVGVYIWYHRWETDNKDMSRVFRDILKRRLEDSITDLERILNEENALEDGRKFSRSLELLIERILDIGQRLRFNWAQDFEIKRSRELLMLIEKDSEQNQNKDICNRLNTIFDNIRNSIF